MKDATATLSNPDGSKIHIDQVNDDAGELAYVRVAVESPTGRVQAVVLPLDSAAYIAGWLAMIAGVGVQGLAQGAVDATAQNAAAADDARGRRGAH